MKSRVQNEMAAQINSWHARCHICPQCESDATILFCLFLFLFLCFFNVYVQFRWFWVFVGDFEKKNLPRVQRHKKPVPEVGQ